MTVSTTLLGRRRFIGIAGAAAGFALLPPAQGASLLLHRWEGIALGARASIQLVHPDAGEVRRIIALAVAEIERLEGIFSLYRSDSAVSHLNRDGRLEAPPLELVDLLSRAAGVSEASGGVFDVTVQPLWARYREHYLTHPEAIAPPAVGDVLSLVDWRGVRIDAGAVAFGRAGMAITLNGIAQGYITDKVADLLRRNGISQLALDLGEARTLGRRADGRTWTIGIADPADRQRIAGRLNGTDRAVATSGGYGMAFDRERRHTHLLNPRTGVTASVGRGLTVVAPDACRADAWSTAFALMDETAVRRHARRLTDLEVYVAEAGTAVRRIL